jgi:hypothetical protein
LQKVKREGLGSQRFPVALVWQLARQVDGGAYDAECLPISQLAAVQLTEATSTILGVEPEQFVSVFKRNAAAARALSPATMLAAIAALGWAFL